MPKMRNEAEEAPQLKSVHVSTYPANKRLGEQRLKPRIEMNRSFEHTEPSPDGSVLEQKPSGQFGALPSLNDSFLPAKAGGGGGYAKRTGVLLLGADDGDKQPADKYTTHYEMRASFDSFGVPPKLRAKQPRVKISNPNRDRSIPTDDATLDGADQGRSRRLKNLPGKPEVALRSISVGAPESRREHAVRGRYADEHDNNAAVHRRPGHVQSRSLRPLEIGESSGGDLGVSRPPPAVRDRKPRTSCVRDNMKSLHSMSGEVANDDAQKALKRDTTSTSDVAGLRLQAAKSQWVAAPMVTKTVAAVSFSGEKLGAKASKDPSSRIMRDQPSSASPEQTDPPLPQAANDRQTAGSTSIRSSESSLPCFGEKVKGRNGRRHTDLVARAEGNDKMRPGGKPPPHQFAANRGRAVSRTGDVCRAETEVVVVEIEDQPLPPGKKTLRRRLKLMDQGKRLSAGSSLWPPSSDPFKTDEAAAAIEAAAQLRARFPSGDFGAFRRISEECESSDSDTSSSSSSSDREAEEPKRRQLNGRLRANKRQCSLVHAQSLTTRNLIEGITEGLPSANVAASHNEGRMSPATFGPDGGCRISGKVAWESDSCSPPAKGKGEAASEIFRFIWQDRERIEQGRYELSHGEKLPSMMVDSLWTEEMEETMLFIQEMHGRVAPLLPMSCFLPLVNMEVTMATARKRLEAKREPPLKTREMKREGVEFPQMEMAECEIQETAAVAVAADVVAVPPALESKSSNLKFPLRRKCQSLLPELDRMRDSDDEVEVSSLVRPQPTGLEETETASKETPAEVVENDDKENLSGVSTETQAATTRAEGEKAADCEQLPKSAARMIASREPPEAVGWDPIAAAVCKTLSCIEKNDKGQWLSAAGDKACDTEGAEEAAEDEVPPKEMGEDGSPPPLPQELDNATILALMDEDIGMSQNGGQPTEGLKMSAGPKPAVRKKMKMVTTTEVLRRGLTDSECLLKTFAIVHENAKTELSKLAEEEVQYSLSGSEVSAEFAKERRRHLTLIREKRVDIELFMKGFFIITGVALRQTATNAAVADAERLSAVCRDTAAREREAVLRMTQEFLSVFGMCSRSADNNPTPHSELAEGLRELSDLRTFMADVISKLKAGESIMPETQKKTESIVFDHPIYRGLPNSSRRRGFILSLCNVVNRGKIKLSASLGVPLFASSEPRKSEQAAKAAAAEESGSESENQSDRPRLDRSAAFELALACLASASKKMEIETQRQRATLKKYCDRIITARSKRIDEDLSRHLKRLPETTVSDASAVNVWVDRRKSILTNPSVCLEPSLLAVAPRLKRLFPPHRLRRRLNLAGLAESRDTQANKAVLEFLEAKSMRDHSAEGAPPPPPLHTQCAQDKVAPQAERLPGYRSDSSSDSEDSSDDENLEDDNGVFLSGSSAPFLRPSLAPPRISVCALRAAGDAKPEAGDPLKRHSIAGRRSSMLGMPAKLADHLNFRGHPFRPSWTTGSSAGRYGSAAAVTPGSFGQNSVCSDWQGALCCYFEGTSARRSAISGATPGSLQVRKQQQLLAVQPEAAALRLPRETPIPTRP